MTKEVKAKATRRVKQTNNNGTQAAETKIKKAVGRKKKTRIHLTT